MTTAAGNEDIKSSAGIGRLASNSNFLFAAGLVAILATLLIPLPTFLLDIGLACSISLSIAVLIIVLATNEPIDLSTFPSLLLVTTLFRLALNVASTRLILLQGNAGTIIDTFGNFVAGGNLIVGLVMFIILVVIQFVVITKGAGRISEVSARFTLDAMPGKQMAIDADLNAGTITDKEAKRRRDSIVRESEFYGAMDGASKFISGDAKAGLIITAVNLVGGILLGYSRGMQIEEAVRRYSVLSIGDGLVSQIPSIIVAVSSGFLVSKIRSEHTMSFEMTRQMTRHSQPLMIASVIIGIFVLVPGFPKLPFIGIAACCGALAYMVYGGKVREGRAEAPQPAVQDKEEKGGVEEALSADILSVLVGVRLISMVDPRKKSGVLERIGALRKKIAQKYGFVIPLVRLRDNINLKPTEYEIRLYDHVIATGSIEPDKFLAMDSGTVQKSVKGIATKEPVYGLAALWINPSDKETAELNGYTVIDPESVLITHLSEVLTRHGHELLTREDVQQLLERLRKVQPSLVGEVVPEVVSAGLVQRVLQNLLGENVSIRDLPLILEALGEHGHRTKNAGMLTEFVRKSLTRAITEQHQGLTGIQAITLEPSLEHYLIGQVNQTADGVGLSIEPDTASELSGRLAEAWKEAMEKGAESAAVLCDARIRAGLYHLIQRSMRRLPVLAYDEIVPGTIVDVISTVSVSLATVMADSPAAVTT